MASTPKANAPAKQLIFLLGKRDAPVDGVQDYCEYLGQALRRRDFAVEIARVDGVSEGWVNALWKLWNVSRDWRGRWVVLQYTALGWSRRGFPAGAVAALAIADRRGARCAVVFHEPFGLRGSRAIDRVRGACQDWVIRKLHDLAETSVFPAPLETIGWLRQADERAVFIPIGANLPDAPPPCAGTSRANSASKTVAVYCLSGPPNLQREIVEISGAVRIAAEGGIKLQVVFLGRGTAEAGEEIRRAFDGIPAESSNLGIQDSAGVRRALERSDVMLCVRGPLYPRRGSALAGIACGLPVIGYGGAAEGTPIAEAGVELVPYGDQRALGSALRRILSERDVWQELHEKSLRTHRRYFDWNLIAEKFDHALGDRNKTDRGTGQ